MAGILSFARSRAPSTPVDPVVDCTAGYHLDSMAATEVVALAERVLADYRSDLPAPNVLADLVKLLDLFAKVGWPDALRLVWRLDEVFR